MTPRCVTREEYEGGGYYGINVGHTTYRNDQGETVQLSVNDPRVLSGEFYGHTKGLTVYRNDWGETIHTSSEDPRVLSGEYYGIRKGKPPSHIGSGQMIRLGIFDQSGDLKYACRGNFKQTCKKHNLPLQRLSKTRSEGSVIEIDTSNIRKETLTKYKNSGVLNYIGWFVRRIDENGNIIEENKGE